MQCLGTTDRTKSGGFDLGVIFSLTEGFPDDESGVVSTGRTDGSVVIVL